MLKVGKCKYKFLLRFYLALVCIFMHLSRGRIIQIKARDEQIDDMNQNLEWSEGVTHVRNMSVNIMIFHNIFLKKGHG